jgi:hypothetical protein
MGVWSFVWTDKWLICLPECHVSFKAFTQLWTAFFIFRSGLSDIRINCNRISEGLMCLYICISMLSDFKYASCHPLSLYHDKCFTSWRMRLTKHFVALHNVQFLNDTTWKLKFCPPLLNKLINTKLYAPLDININNQNVI